MQAVFTFDFRLLRLLLSAVLSATRMLRMHGTMFCGMQNIVIITLSATAEFLVQVCKYMNVIGRTNNSKKVRRIVTRSPTATVSKV